MSKESYRIRRNEEGFLSVGKNVLTLESFQPIENTDFLKPIGGLWATKHNLKDACYNKWVYYLTQNPHIIYHKYQGCDIPSVFFTLKKDARILTIDSKIVIDGLKVNYPTSDGQIDYTALAKDYDGIFVDIMGLSSSNLQEYEEQYCVNTLLLFNLDCILYYKQALVHFEMFDVFDEESIEYNVLAKNTKHYIGEEQQLTRKRR